MPDDLQNLRERIVRLEMQQATTLATVSKIEIKVDEMHELLTRAKGAKWAALMLVTGLAGFAGYIAHIVQVWLNPPPQ